MTQEDLNTRLYEKMFAEQDMYRRWLLGLKPEEILTHTYEYNIREDILMSLEYNELTADQCRALLKRDYPLADIYTDFEHLETEHMLDIWCTVENRADELIRREDRRYELEER